MNRSLRIGPKTCLHRVSPELSASLRIQRLRVLRDATHLRSNVHNSCSIFVVAFSSFLGVVALLRLFIRLFVNLVMREQTLVPGFTTRFCLVELTIGTMPIFTRRSRAITFQILSAHLSKNGTVVTFASDTSFPRHTSTS